MPNSQEIHKNAVKALLEYQRAIELTKEESSAKDVTKSYNERRKAETAKLKDALMPVDAMFEAKESVAGCTNWKEWCNQVKPPRGVGYRRILQIVTGTSGNEGKVKSLHRLKQETVILIGKKKFVIAETPKVSGALKTTDERYRISLIVTPYVDPTKCDICQENPKDRPNGLCVGCFDRLTRSVKRTGKAKTRKKETPKLPEPSSLIVHVNEKPYDIYIGREFYDRANQKQYAASIWGNHTHLPLDKYEDYVRNTPELLRELPSLKGKVLGCWHTPAQRRKGLVCHGDVLLKLIDEFDGTPLPPIPVRFYENGAVTVQADWYTREETQALFDTCAKLDFVRRKVRGKEVRHAVRIFCDQQGAVRRKDALSPLSEAPDAIKKLLANLSKHSGKNVNYAAAVEYRDGEDFIAPHQHDEDRGNDATVWIVSTGAERPFVVKPVKGGTATKFLATQGSLITLSSEANETHLHSVPKCKGCTGVRYSVNCKAIPIKADGKPKRWYKVGADSRTLSIGTKHDKQQAGPVAKAGRATVKVSGDMTDLAKSVAKDGKVVAVTPGSGGIKWKDSGVGDPTGCLTFSTPTLPPTPASLESVLEKDVPEKYNITAKCAAGILRRAASGSRAGKLPPYLEKALKSVAAERDETVIHSSDCDDCHEGEVASHPEPTLEDAVNEAKPSAEK